MIDYKKMLLKPAVISVCADVNSGKSNLLYHFVKTLQEHNKFSLYTFGLRELLPEEIKINSVQELEQVRNSVIIVDEFFSLFDLDNRKQKRLIEATLRLIHHNNNVLILAGLPENFKKFIAGKIDLMLFKKCTLQDFINGGRLKNVVVNYKGKELGSSVLNLAVDEVLFFDGKHYAKHNVPYVKEYDTKKDNEQILQKCAKPVRKIVGKKR